MPPTTCSSCSPSPPPASRPTASRAISRATPRRAVVVGVGFALLPMRLDPLFGGHPAGFALALVPAVLWGLDVALTEGRLAGGLGGGAALVALAMLEPQYTYLAVGPGAARMPGSGSRSGRPAGRASGPLAAFGLLATHRRDLGPDAAPGVRRGVDRRGGPADRGGSALLPRRCRGSPSRPGTAGSRSPPSPSWASRARGRAGDRSFRLLYGVALGLGILLSVGPTIPRFPLYQALHRWVPFFAMIRNPEKLHLLTSVAAIVLAALGARAVLARVGSGRRRRGPRAGSSPSSSSRRRPGTASRSRASATVPCTRPCAGRPRGSSTSRCGPATAPTPGSTSTRSRGRASR